MKRRAVCVGSVVICLCAAWCAGAQQDGAPSGAAQAEAAPAAQPGTVVPRLIRFAGTLTGDTGVSQAGAFVDVTFSLYEAQQGGSPLWSETQQVQLDGQGAYSVLLGAASPEGLPLDLFASGQARWLGIVPALPGAGEQPRVLLVGVPYALKAADADTLGGKAASAFVTVDSLAPSGSGLAANPASVLTAQTPVVALQTNPTPLAGSLTNPAMGPPPAACTAITADGTATANQVPKFTAPCVMHQSLLFDNGTNVGIGTSAPGSKLEVNGATTVRGAFQLPAIGTANAGSGFNSQSSDWLASAYNSTSGTAVNQRFRWQAEPVGSGTSTPSGKLNLLFASGAVDPAETGLSVSSKGVVTFASGQTLPNVSGNESVTGNLSAKQLISTVAAGTAPLQVTSTTQVANLNASMLGGLSASAFALLASPNTFSRTQSVLGRIGVGTTTPSFPVHVSEPDSSGTGIQIRSTNTSTSGNSFAIFSAEADGGTTIADFYADGLGTGALRTPAGIFGTYTNHPLGLMTNNTERLRITATGQVGIGVTDPGSDLLVVENPSEGNRGMFVAGGGGTLGDQGGEGIRSLGGSETAFGSYGGDGIDSYGGSGGANGGWGGFFFGGTGNGGGVGVIAEGGANDGDGIDAYPNLGGYAGYFGGNVLVAGTLYKSGGSFKIDHPLDPANKYLYHSFVESPDMKNIYDGVAVLDGDGAAVIELPEWFETLNRDFRYQLTAMGAPGPNLYVASEISNNSFRIGGGAPGMKVSWQVTGIRQDLWANAHRIPVEEAKSERERGYYLHPELYGQPEGKGVEWGRHPATMKRLQRAHENRGRGTKIAAAGPIARNPQ